MIKILRVAKIPSNFSVIPKLYWRA